MYQPSYLPRLAPTPTAAPAQAPITHTREPIVTATSVLAVKYKDGVMMAADTLASYGSLARFKDMERLLKVGDNTLVGFSGDMSDFQYVKNVLDEMVASEYSLDDGHKLRASQYFHTLATIMYNRRNKMNPLWNLIVVAGLEPNGDSFLGTVDLRGSTYTASTIGTGYGAYLAQPLLRKHVEGRERELTEEQAKRILEESMRVLLYRDARTINRVQVAAVTARGISISQPYQLDTDWTVGSMVEGYK